MLYFYAIVTSWAVFATYEISLDIVLSTSIMIDNIGGIGHINFTAWFRKVLLSLPARLLLYFVWIISPRCIFYFGVRNDSGDELESVASEWICLLSGGAEGVLT